MSSTVTALTSCKKGAVFPSSISLPQFHCCRTIGSNDLPFIFAETTRDHQGVTMQGQVSCKVAEPRQLADLTVDERGLYRKNDLEKVDQRMVNGA